MNKKLEKLKTILDEMQSVLIAYSGGVDSTFLLKVASDVLGDEKIMAVIAESPSFPFRELEGAKKTARDLKIKAITIETDELKNTRFTNNPKDRCYWCKQELFSRLSRVAKQHGLRYVADGTNFDDQGDYRPGMQAARELNIRSPLKEAGFTKEDIRRFSRELNLPTWDKPSFACLASRFPYGMKITRENLSQVDRAERFVRDLGIAQVRVRHHDNLARIEVMKKDIPVLLEHKVNRKILAYFKKLGYAYVSVDLEGYRTGSMNPAPPKVRMIMERRKGGVNEVLKGDNKDEKDIS